MSTPMSGVCAVRRLVIFLKKRDNPIYMYSIKEMGSFRCDEIRKMCSKSRGRVFRFIKKYALYSGKIAHTTRSFTCTPKQNCTNLSVN